MPLSYPPRMACTFPFWKPWMARMAACGVVALESLKYCTFWCWPMRCMRCGNPLNVLSACRAWVMSILSCWQTARAMCAFCWLCGPGMGMSIVLGLLCMIPLMTKSWVIKFSAPGPRKAALLGICLFRMTCLACR